DLGAVDLEQGERRGPLRDNASVDALVGPLRFGRDRTTISDPLGVRIVAPRTDASAAAPVGTGARAGSVDVVECV
ncbi:MAG: hypothetical protein ACR2GZ_02810, partial [Solirubrobacteraceae bacterium]